MSRTARLPLQACVLKLAQDLWRDLAGDWFGSYRPELHYMRGRGPKWREKHAHALASARRPHRMQIRDEVGRAPFLISRDLSCLSSLNSARRAT